MGQGQCIKLQQTGGPDVLQLSPLDLAEPGPGDVRLRVHAAGLNFIDIYHRTGLYPVKLPFVPGVEAAGTIEAVGEGVSDFNVGDRVGYLGAGAYATHLNAPANRLIALPDEVGDEAAAAVLLKGLTAWMLCFEVRRPNPGESALVWAPVGGVGSLLVPWLRSLGVNVIAVTSTPEKANAARALGANHVLMRGDDVAAGVRAITGGIGVDVSYDSVGKASQTASLNALKPKGWWVTYGNASGPADPVPPGQLNQLGSLVMTRPGLFHFIADRPSLMRGAAALFGALAAGTLCVRISQTYGLAEASKAQEHLASGTTQGALVIKPD
ncbi:MAG: quinone oxidoreductase [Pseudomonadota bacterium]